MGSKSCENYDEIIGWRPSVMLSLSLKVQKFNQRHLDMIWQAAPHLISIIMSTILDLDVGRSRIEIGGRGFCEDSDLKCVGEVILRHYSN